MALDGNSLLWIQDALRNVWLTPVMIGVTSLGNGGTIWLIISMLLLSVKKTRYIGIMSLMALLGSYIISNLLLKNIIARIRPYEVVIGLQQLIEKPGDFSFPSGHTSSSFAAAIILYKELHKGYGIPAMILATLIGSSRLYLGVHYPSDVICGALIGSIIALTTRCVYYELIKRKA